MLHWKNNKKYEAVLKHIIEHKPKFIVEYGPGNSTFCINQLLEELDYGAKFISFESEDYYFNFHKNKGYFDESTVKMAPIEYVDKDLGWVKYVHSYEGFEDVDLVIIDGPNLQQYVTSTGSPSNVTTNLEEIVAVTGKEVYYFIDGRGGTLAYYKEKLGYKLNIQQYL